MSLPRSLLVTVLASRSGATAVVFRLFDLAVIGLAADRAAACIPRFRSMAACLSVLCGLIIVLGR
jgi:hypothetical protein